MSLDQGGEPESEYPTSEELHKTFGPDAQETIYDQLESSDFIDNYDITPDEQGQDKLGNLLLNTSLREEPQKSRDTFSGRVTKLVTQLKDENLVSDDNPYGLVPGTRKEYTIPDEHIPNTRSTLNPGIPTNKLPEIKIGQGISIIYTLQVVIDEPI